jgi:hypothetical protein
MEDFIEGLGIFLCTIILIGVAAFITGLIVWPLWNWLMPTLFNLPEITYIQACGISWLCGCLFKSVSYNKN